MKPVYQYLAVVHRVVDGDTLDVLVDLGFRNFSKQRIRLYGINTPEMHGVKKESEEYKKGIEARDAVFGWLDEHADVSDGDPSGTWSVMLHSFDGEAFGQGKYGRWLALVHSASEVPIESLNDYLVRKGFATEVEY